MKILHFVSGHNIYYNVRVQRFLQHSIDSSDSLVLFHEKGELRYDSQRVWVPDFCMVDEVTYKKCRRLDVLLPSKADPVGLGRVFQSYGCEVVHAHNLFAAFYSANLGLPTIFDDWEYALEFFHYLPLLLLHYSNRECLQKFVRAGTYFGLPLKLLNRYRSTGIVKRLLKTVPVFVTNRYVKEAYERLGAKAFFVPNVPLRFERDYVESRNIQKADATTTCYIGSFEHDNMREPVRDASGVPELWRKHDIGRLFVFDGRNRCSHLEMLCKLKSFHFNLLFWKPKPFHRYYNQNKAFLASAVGVPTIISASLVDTVNLLGEYALPVMQLEDIPLIIKMYKQRSLLFNPEHVWEYYANDIKAAYEAVGNSS